MPYLLGLTRLLAMSKRVLWSAEMRRNRVLYDIFYPNIVQLRTKPPEIHIGQLLLTLMLSQDLARAVQTEATQLQG